MLRLSNHLDDGTKQVDEYRLSLASQLSLNGDKESIWFRVRFSDAEAKKEAKRHDVSIQLVKRLIDANKIEYSPGIEHVALTTRPAIPGLGPWIDDPTDPLVATKELLYEGDFYQDSTKIAFSFDNKYLNDVLDSAAEQIQNKVRIPLQLTHEDGTGRGEVIQFFKAKRYHEGYTKSLSAVKRFKTNDSVTFLALALSLDATSTKAEAMGDSVTLDELISLLGVTVAADADPAAKMEAVKAEIQAFVNWKQTQASGGGDGTEPDAELSANGGGTTGGGQSIAQQLQPRKVAMTVALSATQVKQQQSANEMLADSYVENGWITPAEKTKLMEDFNSDTAVRISLSANQATSPFVSTLKLLKDAHGGNAVPSNGRTKLNNGQGKKLALSANGGKQLHSNPMLAARGLTED